MGNNSTAGRRRYGVATLVLLGACTFGEDPDPRQFASRTAMPVPTTWEAPIPVVAWVEPRPDAAAPLAETRPQTGPRRGARIVLGQHAVHVIDETIQRGFAALDPGSEPTFVPRTDRDAIELLLVGEADFAVVGTELSERERRAGLCQTRLGVELFALAVAPGSPVASLSRQQVRQIFTGTARDWRDLGFAPGPIVAVAPSEQKKAERAARALLPGDPFAESVVRVATNRHVADQILQHPTAIGVVTIDADKVSGMKLVSIDLCPPTPEAYEHGTYPFGVPIHLVTAGLPNGEAQRFLDHLRGAAREPLTAKLCLP